MTDKEKLESFFEKKIVDATGKEISKEDMSVIIEKKKEELKDLKKFVQENKDSELLSEFSRQRR